jgi:hypothetical protein
MGKYTKTPGMHEISYNSWLGKVHKKLNDRVYSASINRDFFSCKERTEYGKRTMKNIREKEKMQPPVKIDNNCQPCDLFIYKNKMINRDPLLMPLLKLCKMFTGFGIITINKKQHYNLAN